MPYVLQVNETQKGETDMGINMIHRRSRPALTHGSQYSGFNFNEINKQNSSDHTSRVRSMTELCQIYSYGRMAFSPDCNKRLRTVKYLAKYLNSVSRQ
jgi:hypothetical protein